MPVRSIRCTLLQVPVLACALLLPTVSIHAQDALAVARWFQMGSPEIDDQANEAVHYLSRGMATLIIAFDSGRKRESKSPVNLDMAKGAIADMESARSAFHELEGRVKGHKIDLATIQKENAEKQYYDLMDTLEQNGYKPPVDWDSYMGLLQDIIERIVSDLHILISPQSNLTVLERAFLDLISQKILLEKIGAVSGFITVAME